MRFTSPSRRALGLLAASTIGMSTAVLGVAGVATAAPTPAPFVFTSATPTATVPAGYCAIDVLVYGGLGGDGSESLGADGGLLDAVIPVEAGEVLDLFVGTSGTDADGTTPGTGGVNSDPADDGYADGEDGSADADELVFSGGGGAASTISVGGTVIAAAFGGDGGDADVTDFGFGGGGGENFAATDEAYSETASTDGSAPGITGSGVLCVADAPYLNFVDPGDGSVTVDFVAPEDDNGIAITGYEVTVDGGTTWTALATTTDEGRTNGTVTGLVNDQAYSVGVRAVGGTANELKGEASQFQSATPYKPLPAPVITSLTTGPSQVTLTWTAVPGDVAGYDVGWFRGEQGNGGCATAPTVLTCTFVVPAGEGYDVSVRAIDSASRAGTSATRSGVTVPGPAVPSSVPTKDDGDIVGPAGPISSVTAGQKLTLVGSGFAPNSTVQLTVFSAPISLGTVVTDQDGAFSVEVTIPANLANGTHNLVATGIAPDGSTRNLVITVTVSGGVVTGTTLANTGVDTAVPLTGGAIALLAGAGLLVAARRRSN